MKNIKHYFISGCLLFLAGCGKPPRNLYSDQDDPGLSRLTYYGYNIATNYINGVAYVNPYNDPNYYGFGGGNANPSLIKYLGKGATDTLALSWPIEENTQSPVSSAYINLLLIVPKNFTASNFVALSGQRFTNNTNDISVSSNYYFYNSNFYDSTALVGTSNIYFIDIQERTDSAISMTGLFNGIVGNDTITNGRFDFYIPKALIRF